MSWLWFTWLSRWRNVSSTHTSRFRWRANRRLIQFFFQWWYVAATAISNSNFWRVDESILITFNQSAEIELIINTREKNWNKRVVICIKTNTNVPNQKNCLNVWTSGNQKCKRLKENFRLDAFLFCLKLCKLYILKWIRISRPFQQIPDDFCATSGAKVVTTFLGQQFWQRSVALMVVRVSTAVAASATLYYGPPL